MSSKLTILRPAFRHEFVLSTTQVLIVIPKPHAIAGGEEQR
jgi:hypothetical protein